MGTKHLRCHTNKDNTSVYFVKFEYGSFPIGNILCGSVKYAVCPFPFHIFVSYALQLYYLQNRNKMLPPLKSSIQGTALKKKKQQKTISVLPVFIFLDANIQLNIKCHDRLFP